MLLHFSSQRTLARLVIFASLSLIPLSRASSSGETSTSSIYPSEDDIISECLSLVKNGRYTSAFSTCQSAVGGIEKKDTNYSKLMLAFAEAQENTGRHLLALNTLKKIIEVEGDNEVDKESLRNAHLKMAKIHLKMGEFALAKEDLKDLAESDMKQDQLKKKNDLMDQIKKAELLMNSINKNVNDQKWKLVDTECRDLISEYCNWSKEVHDIRIKSLTMLKEWQRAIDAARSKARIETDPSETDFLIGKIYLSMGNLALGKKFVNECAKLNPENRKCMTLRSKIKSFESQLEEAEKRMLLKDSVETLERMMKEGVEDGVPSTEPFYDPMFPQLFEAFRLPVMKVLCAKYARRKQTDKALKTCQAAKSMDTKNQEIFYLGKLGELYLSQDDYDEAINYFQQALNINPRDREMKELMQKAQQKKTEKARTKYYDTLGISKDATEEQIKKAYNHLVRKWHPDKQPDEESKKAAQEKMHNINAAYDVLSDKNKRAQYDQGFDPNDPNAGASGFGGHGGFGGGFGGGGMHFNMDDLAKMFNQQGRRGHGGHGGRGGNRGGYHFYHDDL